MCRVPPRARGCSVAGSTSHQGATLRQHGTPLPCSVPTELAPHTTCNTLPHVRLLSTWSTLWPLSNQESCQIPGTGHHPGLVRGSRISHVNRTKSPVGKRCYPPHCAVCALVAQGHTRRLGSEEPKTLSPYENRRSGYCQAPELGASATVSVPV